MKYFARLLVLIGAAFLVEEIISYVNYRGPSESLREFQRGTLLEFSIAFSIFTLVIYLMQLVREGKILPNSNKKRLVPALAVTAVTAPFIILPIWKKDIMVTVLIVAISAALAYVAYRWRK